MGGGGGGGADTRFIYEQIKILYILSSFCWFVLLLLLFGVGTQWRGATHITSSAVTDAYK